MLESLAQFCVQPTRAEEGEECGRSYRRVGRAGPGRGACPQSQPTDQGSGLYYLQRKKRRKWALVNTDGPSSEVNSTGNLMWKQTG